MFRVVVRDLPEVDAAFLADALANDWNKVAVESDSAARRRRRIEAAARRVVQAVIDADLDLDESEYCQALYELGRLVRPGLFVKRRVPE